MELPPPIKIPLEKEVCTFINVHEIFIEWIKQDQKSIDAIFWQLLAFVADNLTLWFS